MSTKKTTPKSAVLKYLKRNLTGAEVVKSLRECLAMTQVELAKKVGVSKVIICDIEKGRRLISGKMSIKLAHALDYTPEAMFEIAKNDEAKKLGLKLKAA